MIEISEETEFRRDVLIAFQTALLGMVTPNLRGVSVNWDNWRIAGLFVYEGQISELEKEIVSDIEGEVISHFSRHTIDLMVRECDAKVDLEQFSLGVWVYQRSEWRATSEP